MDDAIKKLNVLLDYIIKHNAEHAEEIRELAEGAKRLGETAAQAKIESGVELLLRSNEELKAAYAILQK